MTTKRVKPPTEAEVRALVEKNWAEWCDSHGTDAAIAHRVAKRLEANVDDTMAKLLGFSKNSWGTWEVDHCNGRAGNSIVGDYIRKRVGVALESWIGGHADALPALPKATVAALRTEYVSMFHTALRRRLGEIAYARANAKADEMIAALEEAAQSEGADP